MDTEATRTSATARRIAAHDAFTAANADRAAARDAAAALDALIAAAAADTDEPWGCAACGAGASHQSVSYPSLCTDCAVEAVRRLF